MKIEFIEYICAALGTVLSIAFVIAAFVRKCCFQNPTYTIRPSNQRVRTITGNAQPMTLYVPTQENLSQFQMQSPYYGQQPAYSDYIIAQVRII